MPYFIEQRDSDIVNSTASVRYHWFFDQPYRHLLRIQMEIDINNTQQPLILGLPVWIPGSYKIRDYISAIGNLNIYGNDGQPLDWSWKEKNRLVLHHPTVGITVNYDYYGYERDSTIRSSHITRSHAFINPVTCCFYVEGFESAVHHIILHHDRSIWKKISTPLSLVHPTANGDSPIILGALNYDILIDSPVEIGNHYTHSFITHDAEIQTAIVGGGNYDPEWITQHIQTIVQTEALMWGGLPFDRYVFILHLFPGMRGGGLEHARCSVNAMEDNNWQDISKLQQLLSLLCHEFFHVWNVKRIRPVELGPFNYNTENYTSMLWLVEGATSYYDDLLVYRCGFYTKEEYLKVLSKDHLGKYFRIAGKNRATIKDNSWQAWVKLYLPHDESNNQNISYYLHGGLLFLLLDLWIIAHSCATKRLDDVFRSLWAAYQTRPETGITEAEFITIAELSTGLKLSGIITDWLHTKNDLPFEEIFALVGLRLLKIQQAPEQSNSDKEASLISMKKPAKVFTGLSVKSQNGRVLVSAVEDHSPASRVQIGVDDEIICIQGLRVTSVEEFETVLNKSGTQNTCEIIIASESGSLMLYIQPEPYPEISLSFNEAATEQEIKFRNYWLER